MAAGTRSNRKYLFFAGILAVLGVWAWYASRDLPELDGPAARAALAGNTVVGVWEGTPYRQYFAPDGSTTYVWNGDEPVTGEWQVTGEGGVCTRLPPSRQWNCNGVWKQGELVVWVTAGTGRAYPASLLQGRQLEWNGGERPGER